jgi:RNA polymerase sigma factor (TIGR02999 family)
MTNVTQILNSAERGDPRVAQELLPLLYEELRKLAASRLSREREGQTLQATALVHEAWMRLNRSPEQSFEGRAHFFAAAAETMRRILVERARRKNAVRHGGNQQRLDIEGLEIPCPLSDQQLLEVHEALDRFAVDHPIPAELIKLRYFAGFSAKEAASVLGISPDTAKDYAAFARAWLYRDITRQR